MGTTPVQTVPPTIMVVDNDEFSHAALQLTLSAMGFTHIHKIHNGRDGAHALDRMGCPPDFLICEIYMPDMDGIEFVGELAKRNYQGGLILLTGGSEDMLDIAREIATNHGLRVLGALNKPVSQDALESAFAFSDQIGAESPLTLRKQLSY